MSKHIVMILGGRGSNRTVFYPRQGLEQKLLWHPATQVGRECRSRNVSIEDREFRNGPTILSSMPASEFNPVVDLPPFSRQSLAPNCASNSVTDNSVWLQIQVRPGLADSADHWLSVMVATLPQAGHLRHPNHVCLDHSAVSLEPDWCIGIGGRRVCVVFVQCLGVAASSGIGGRSGVGVSCPRQR